MNALNALFKRKCRITFEGFSREGETVFPQDFMKPIPYFEKLEETGEIIFERIYCCRSPNNFFESKENIHKIAYGNIVLYDGCGMFIKGYKLKNTNMKLVNYAYDKNDDEIFATWSITYDTYKLYT